MFIRSKIVNDLKRDIETLYNNYSEIEDSITRIENLQNKLLDLENTIDAVQVTLDELNKLKEKNLERKNSEEPWADFSTELTTDGRVKVKFDWNKAMIQELRRMGFNAQSEEDIISAYFSRLIAEHGDVLSQEELDEIRNA